MFDVGCNNGNNSEYYVNNDYKVFAFEPTPKLCAELSEKFKNNSNFTLIKKAVSNVEGVMNFNVAGLSDWGCSSLLNFLPDLTINWGGRGDFKVTEIIKVDVIRLDTFIKYNNILSIDYLHCDAQGLDLSVLESLGQYINIVKKGTVEVANKRDVLYTNSNNYINDVVEFLEKNNFKILDIKSNDGLNNESNVLFLNKCNI